MERKKLSTWVQAVRIWVQQRKENGLDVTIPKKGSSEHAKILEIARSIDAGIITSSNSARKVKKSKPTRADTNTNLIMPAGETPKIKVTSSTHRVGDTSSKSKNIQVVRAEASKKALEKDVARIEKDKEKFEARVEKRASKLQDNIVKLLTKLEKENLTEAERKDIQNEVKAVQKEITILNESVDKEKKRLEQEEKALKLAADAKLEQAKLAADVKLEQAKLARATEDLKKQQGDLEEFKPFKDAFMSDKWFRGYLPGLTRKLGKQESDDIDILVLADETKSKKINWGARKKAKERIQKLVDENALFPTKSKEDAERLEKLTGIKDFFTYPISYNEFKILGDENEYDHINPGEELPNRVRNLPPLQTRAQEALANLIEHGAPPTADASAGPSVELEEVAPTTAAVVNAVTDPDTTVVVEPEQIAELTTALADMAAIGDGPDVGTGSALCEITGGYILAGSRNSGPIGLGRTYKGPLIKGGAIKIQTGHFQTNPEALRIADQLKVESKRLQELGRRNIPVLVKKAGQSLHPQKM